MKPTLNQMFPYGVLDEAKPIETRPPTDVNVNWQAIKAITEYLRRVVWKTKNQ